MEVATALGDPFGGAIATLQRRVTAQDKELKLLRAAVGVLAATLCDMLDARLEAAMANAEEEGRQRCEHRHLLALQSADRPPLYRSDSRRRDL